ncbi:hypothetical protein EVAR_24346_1 [Eumeta japonica]|uniref:Uncharacterized protein n=1 Tax=Eumeta variegata TaxID=151549 RepID=A0A4C1VN88_EUMVA|nr:hypothetical protein EVAR_24346_1 [Eumeta japonica]
MNLSRTVNGDGGSDARKLSNSSTFNCLEYSSPESSEFDPGVIAPLSSSLSRGSTKQNISVTICERASANERSVQLEKFATASKISDFHDKRTGEPSENKRSSPPMYTRNLREVTCALPASFIESDEGKNGLIEGEVE